MVELEAVTTLLTGTVHAEPGDADTLNRFARPEQIGALAARRRDTGRLAFSSMKTGVSSRS